LKGANKSALPMRRHKFKRKEKTEVADEVKKAEQQRDEWNRKYESGQSVEWKDGKPGSSYKTAGRAFVSARKAVIRLDGIGGHGIPLNKLSAVIE
jgi:hypothetical protein